MNTKQIRRYESNNAMVSSGRKEATDIGIQIFKKGGNAIDAAVAVGFAMGVAEPATSGLGGGGFMTINLPGNSESIFIDFRENAPKSAYPDMWCLDEKGKVIDKANAIGAKSISVPGEVAGLIYVLENYGTMTLEEVMAPTIKLAEEGIVVTAMLENMLGIYGKHLEKCESAKDIYCKDFKEGDLLRNKKIANTLKTIAFEGRDVFYKGKISKEIIKSVQDMGGLLTKEDLEEYEVEVKEPVVGEYRGYTIISSPPPSSGGTHIIQSLNILENFDIGSLEVNSAEYLHMFSEAFKLSYEDRAKFMADTKFIDVPLKGLRSKKYAKVLSKKIDLNTARKPECYDPWNYEHDDTTHYSIGDKEGYLVSVTKTINHFFGSCMVGGNTGILLNDTMADFSTNKYDVNSVDSRKKPLSSMSPTLILKDGKPVAIIGSPGGVRIINVIVQIISKIVDHGMDIQEAIESPRITQNATNTMLYENRISSKVIEDLKAMGHDMNQCLDYDKKMGGVNGIYYTEDGKIIGAADPRRDGVAYGI
ncbi:gamma-glutamyltransferase [Clostridiaceae bacterium HSG29]|nr:gamma-glutamyltransferase [Clostridiaceae bacterium HSG29]